MQPFCVTLDFKLFIDSIHILFWLYLLLWVWDFHIKNLQDFTKKSRALIKDIFLVMIAIEVRFLAQMCLGVVHSTKLRDFSAQNTYAWFL